MKHAMLDPDEFWAAFKPVLDLVGATPLDIYDESGVRIQWDASGTEISFRKAAPEGSDEPWTVVKVGSPDFAEYAYDVRYHVPAAGVIKRYWPDAEFRESAQVEPTS